MIVNKITVEIWKMSRNYLASDFLISLAILRFDEFDSFEKILSIEINVIYGIGTNFEG